jgi:hypothetical protein
MIRHTDTYVLPTAGSHYTLYGYTHLRRITYVTRICTIELGHIRYTDIHTTAVSHYALYRHTHYSRVTLYFKRIFTLEKGHIIRYADIHTTAGLHYTLYRYIYNSRVTSYVIRMYTLQQGHNVCYTDFLTRSSSDTRYTNFHAVSGSHVYSYTILKPNY